MGQPVAVSAQDLEHGPSSGLYSDNGTRAALGLGLPHPSLALLSWPSASQLIPLSSDASPQPASSHAGPWISRPQWTSLAAAMGTQDEGDPEGWPDNVQETHTDHDEEQIGGVCSQDDVDHLDF